MKTRKKISSNLFNFVEINITCDDYIVDVTESDDCSIILTCNHNMGEIMDQYLENSTNYEIDTEIVDEVLYINFSKPNFVPLTDYDFDEEIIIEILVPKSIKYKII